MKGNGSAARRDEDELVRQLRAGGCPEEEIAKLTGQEGDGGDFEIWPENADALRAFLFAWTQWRAVAGMGGIAWLGLDYNVIYRWLDHNLQPDEDDFWWALKILEGEAVTLRNQDAD